MSHSIRQRSPICLERSQASRAERFLEESRFIWRTVNRGWRGDVKRRKNKKEKKGDVLESCWCVLGLNGPFKLTSWEASHPEAAGNLWPRTIMFTRRVEQTAPLDKCCLTRRTQKVPFFYFLEEKGQRRRKGSGNPANKRWRDLHVSRSTAEMKRIMYNTNQYMIHSATHIRQVMEGTEQQNLVSTAADTNRIYQREAITPPPPPPIITPAWRISANYCLTSRTNYQSSHDRKGEKHEEICIFFCRFLVQSSFKLYFISNRMSSLCINTAVIQWKTHISRTTAAKLYFCLDKHVVVWRGSLHNKEWEDLAAQTNFDLCV